MMTSPACITFAFHMFLGLYGVEGLCLIGPVVGVSCFGMLFSGLFFGVLKNFCFIIARDGLGM